MALKRPNKKKTTPGSAKMAPYWVERRRYLKQLREIPELRQRWWGALSIYLIRRALWCFGFFPVFLAFWVPLVMSNFNPVVMLNDLIPKLQAFVDANPQVQANTIETLIVAWISISLFFLVFDFVLTPFRSPYETEADVHMRAWEQRMTDRSSGDDEPQPTDHSHKDDATPSEEQVPDKL